MLKFKKTGETLSSSPAASPAPSPRQPKLVTRIDSIGGPAERERVSLFENNENEDSDSSEENSSAEEFATPGAKLREVTKTKLNRLRVKQLKLSAKKEQNLLSSKDFSSRQHELKIWIHETTGKDIASLSHKKLMEYFKKFVKKWNKRKLPRKYYRGVDLHSSPLPAVSSATKPAEDTTPKQSHDSSSLWIAPPIPLIEHFSDSESLSPTPAATSTITPAASVGSTFGKKFATVTRTPAQASKICIEGIDCDVKTPPKPPERKRPSTIKTSLSGSTESVSSNPSACNSSGVRFPQPRMGSIMSSMRRGVGPSLNAVSTFEEHKLQDNEPTFVPKETIAVETEGSVSNEGVPCLPDSDAVGNPTVCPVNTEVSHGSTDEVTAASVTDEGNGQTTDNEQSENKVEAGEHLSDERIALELPTAEDVVLQESQAKAQRSLEKRPADTSVEKEHKEVTQDSQMSPNKKARWVEQVQNTKESYV